MQDVECYCRALAGWRYGTIAITITITITGPLLAESNRLGGGPLRGADGTVFSVLSLASFLLLVYYLID